MLGSKDGNMMGDDGGVDVCDGGRTYVLIVLTTMVAAVGLNGLAGDVLKRWSL